MSRFHSLQNNGTAGELSSRLRRTDLEKYQNGFSNLTNLYSLPQGPITRIPGTQFISNALNTTDTSTGQGGKLVSFTSSTRKRYMLEFGNQQVKIINGDGTSLAIGDIFRQPSDQTQYTLWTPVITTDPGYASPTVASLSQTNGNLNFTAATDGGGKNSTVYGYIVLNGLAPGNYSIRITTGSFAGGTLTFKAGISGPNSTEIISSAMSASATNNINFTIPYSSTGAYNVVYATIGTANIPPNTSVITDMVTISSPTDYIIPSPYTLAQLPSLSVAQSADVLFFAQAGVKPQTLSSLGPTTWLFQPVTFDDGPYQAPNAISTQKLTPSATTGNITITATGFSPFLNPADLVGQYIRLQHGTTTITIGWAQITSVNSPTQVNATVEQAFGATTATSVFRLPEWGGVRGWPEIVFFHESRIGYASTAASPSTIWLSQTQGYSPSLVLMGPTKSDGTVTSDMSITAPLAARNINKILWCNPGPVLAIGTTDGEWILQSSSQNEALTPTNARAVIQTTRGSKPYSDSVRVENSVVFVKAKGRRLCSFAFDLQQYNYSSSDLNLLSDQILIDADPNTALGDLAGVQQIAYAQDPDSLIIARMGTGELRCLTYIIGENVGGWSRNVIAGPGWTGISGLSGNARVLSMAVLQDPIFGYDAVWMIVERFVNGSIVCTVEKSAPPLHIYKTEEAVNGWYVDGGIRKTNVTPFTTVTGLGHLEGLQVAVIASGAPQPFKTVSGGSITLDSPQTNVLVGLPKTWAMTGIPQDWSSKGPATKLGTSRGKKTSLPELDINVYKTGAFMYGVADSGSLPVMMSPWDGFRNTSENLDTVPTTKSGWYRLSTGATSLTDPVLCLSSDTSNGGVMVSLPFTLLEVALHGEVNEG